MSLNRRELILLITLFIVSFFVRFVYISQPQGTVFDEGAYANFSSLIIQGKGYFDIHPTFAVQVFASIAKGRPWPGAQTSGVNLPFGDFPYINIRMFNAILGSLLVVVIYLIGKKIYPKSISPFLPAFFVAFDPALVMYSRLVLPDMILIFSGFVGFVFVVVAMQVKTKTGRAVSLCLAGLFLGMAVSTKWTGLGFFLATAILFAARKKYVFILVAGSIIVAVYSLVFLNFYTHSKVSGIKNFKSQYHLIQDAPFPDPKDTLSVLVFLPEYTKLMYRLNYTPELNASQHAFESRPYEWPVGSRPMLFFYKDSINNERLVLMPNISTWLITFVAIVILVFGFAASAFGVLPSPGRMTAILLGAYFVNYAPLFFITRMLFIYHYFAALIFGFLLVPLAVEYASLLFKDYLLIKSFPERKIKIVAYTLAIIGFLAALRPLYGI